ncbi:MAG: nuclear transport factor 2 family protein [Candidatus Limnocylindrales bacterium]|nr:nuclear transport factor 2 family protein [Candidatus Limnocylindrales bacterium]
MQSSAEVRGTMLRFYEQLSAKDVASLDRLVSSDPATLVIGTAPGEWVTERDRLRYGFEVEGLGIEPGPSATGHERGDVGWFVDEPTYIFPDGSRMQSRMTAILQREDGDWRIVHMHVSVGVADEEVVGLQARWGR